MGGILLILVGLASLFVLVRMGLDDRYYAGPVSDHFDGERFFNPGPSCAGSCRAASRPGPNRCP
jgi:hypothetical protein